MNRVYSRSKLYRLPLPIGSLLLSSSSSLSWMIFAKFSSCSKIFYLLFIPLCSFCTGFSSPAQNLSVCHCCISETVNVTVCQFAYPLLLRLDMEGLSCIGRTEIGEFFGGGSVSANFDRVVRTRNFGNGRSCCFAWGCRVCRVGLRPMMTEVIASQERERWEEGGCKDGERRPRGDDLVNRLVLIQQGLGFWSDDAVELRFSKEKCWIRCQQVNLLMPEGS